MKKPLLAVSKLPTMNLDRIVNDFGDALFAIDSERRPFKTFQPGVGPYGEPQLLKLVAEHLNILGPYTGMRTRRTPDLLIPGQWAIECKVARPFGDNGKQAENWSVNLLHPYEGNVSLIGDCLKLRALSGSERKAVLVIGYEHTPPQINLAPLFRAFELVAAEVAGVRLSSRFETTRVGLVHPVHRQLLVVAWEVL